MSLIDLLGRGFGSVTPPAAPTLTVTDNGDGTGAVATVAGSTAGSVNQVYTCPRTGTAWTLKGTRTGNGTVAMSLATGGYFAIVFSTLSGAMSVSSVATINVTDSTTAGGIVQQVCDALVATLATADLAGAFAETLSAARTYTTDLDLPTPVGTLSALVIPVFTTRRRTSNGTYRRDVVTEILIRSHLTSIATADDTTTDAKIYLSEQIDDYLANPTYEALTLAGGLTAYYVEPIDERAEGEIRKDMGVVWMREHLDELRQITAMVRVAYAIDVSY